MILYAHYDIDSGWIHKITTDFDNTANCLQVDSLSVSGYVDAGEIKPFPTPQPAPYYAYDKRVGWVDTRPIDVKESEAKSLRNKLLLETDWTQLPDVSESVRTAYQTYRQALRDIPQQAGFPDNIVWPTKPE